MIVIFSLSFLLIVVNGFCSIKIGDQSESRHCLLVSGVFYSEEIGRYTFSFASERYSPSPKWRSQDHAESISFIWVNLKLSFDSVGRASTANSPLNKQLEERKGGKMSLRRKVFL